MYKVSDKYSCILIYTIIFLNKILKISGTWWNYNSFAIIIFIDLLSLQFQPFSNN